MKKLALFSVAALFSACMVPQQGSMWGTLEKSPYQQQQQALPQQQQQEYVYETVNVITDPPSIQIEVNGSFMGTSPIKINVRRMWRGDPGYPMTLDTVKIEALPAGPGQCRQAGIFGENAAKSPPQVSFNMLQCGGSAPAYAPDNKY